MVKIPMYMICKMLLLANAIESYTITLCENSEIGYQNITCPKEETISWKAITYGESLCQETSNSDICLSNINTYFNDYCLGQNKCTLPVDVLSNNNCRRPPRRFKVNFECSWFLRINYHDKTVHICADSLAEVGCSRWYRIRITNVTEYNDASGCTSLDTSNVKKSLITLCDGRNICSADKTRHSSLFHKRFASISYVCKGPANPLVTETIRSTSSGKTLPELSLDDDHRVKLYHHSLGQQLYLCSLGWDDFDAGVLCKSFNITWIGKATVVDNMLDLQTAPYYMQCGGLETSLFDCNYTTDVKGCNITQVAGAICCQGTDKPGECFMNLSPNQVSFEFSTLGVAVGIPAACIAVVCIIVVIVFIRRRSMESNCDKKNRNSLTRNGEESRIQETESYECTNVASRLSDHTYDPLESTELNCKSKDRKFQKEHKESLTSKSDVSRIRETGFDECPNVASGLSDHTYDPLESAELHCKPIDSNFQNENKESLAGNEEKSKISENCFYESTSVTSRLSDHTYDPIESAEYYNMTNVSVSSAK